MTTPTESPAAVCNCGADTFNRIRTASGRDTPCPAVVRPAVEALLAEERATAEKRRQQRDIFRRLWEDTREGEQRFEAERDTLRRELAEAREALAALDQKGRSRIKRSATTTPGHTRWPR